MVCADSLVLSLFLIINRIILIAKITIPIIIIVATMFDVIKDVTGKKVEYKTSLSKIKYRLISAVLIFFAPTLVGALFRVVTTDYSTNNLECLLQVSSADVESAREAELDEILENLENAVKTGETFDELKMDEASLKIAAIKNEDMKKVYYNKQNTIRDLRNKTLEKEMEAHLEEIAKKILEQEQEVQKQNGADTSSGSSKSGVSLLEHNKPFTGAVIKYYSQNNYHDMSKEEKGSDGKKKTVWYTEYRYHGNPTYYKLQNCGCGFTSLAMIIDGLTGSNLTPKGILNAFPPKIYASGECAINDSTLLDNQGKIKNDYGIEVNTLFGPNRRAGVQSESTKKDRKEKIVNALKHGNSVIVLIPWHYIVLGAIDENNLVSIYDPSNSSNNGWYTIDQIYDKHYNHGNHCTNDNTCGYVMAIAYKGKKSITSLYEYHKKYDPIKAYNPVEATIQ